MNSSTSSPTGAPNTQGGTPQSASAGVPSHAGGTLSDRSESAQTRQGGPSGSNCISTPAGLVPGTVPGEGGGGLSLPVAAVSPSGSPSILSAHLQHELSQRGGPGNTIGLSKEQLEHRERSLQTLRDLERLFLRTGTGGCPPDTRGSNSNLNNNSYSVNNNRSDQIAVLEDGDNGTNNTGNCGGGNMALSALALMGRIKKYEEPLQSILSQTQSLSGPAPDSPQMDPTNLPLHPHHQMSSPGVDMGPLLGPEGLTREQIAWRKLQEEYYQEKRRQQERPPATHPQHFRMMTEVGMHGGHVMMRGPPPPYHSKPGDQQWGTGTMMGGGMGVNSRLIDMHQERPCGPRFIGQMQRGPLGGVGYPGSPGVVLPIDGPGPQAPSRPGMIWLEDMSNNMGGGHLHDCFSGGLPQHLQDDPEHPLTREEMFRIMEKRQQMQGLPRFELERIARQQQQQQQQGNLSSRIMDNPVVLDFPNSGMGRGPPTNRGDPMDFPGTREIMGSPTGGQLRDMGHSPLGSNVSMNMNPQMNVQQQHVILSQKLREGPTGGGSFGEIFSPGETSRIRASQNERSNKGMLPAPDGPFHFSNQGAVSGGHLQQPASEMFVRDQMDGTSRLTHMPVAGGPRGAGLGPQHPGDLSVTVHPLASPTGQISRQLKSPSLIREASPFLASPSAPGLKSPSQISSTGHQPPLPPASGAGTPSSSSMKSPQIMGSSNLGLHSPASISPGRLKSPAMAAGSPGWTSPKTAPPSPGGPTSGRLAGNGRINSTETGTLTLNGIF